MTNVLRHIKLSAMGPASVDIPQWLRPGQVAEMLGVNAITVSRWARDGRIPYLATPGGHLRFRRADIDRIVANGTFTPATDGEAS